MYKMKNVCAMFNYVCVQTVQSKAVWKGFYKNVLDANMHEKNGVE